MTAWDEVQLRRLKYFEQKLNRLASEVGGKTSYEAERVTAICDEIDALRKELTELAERVQRMADFLNQLKSERKNGESHD